MSQRTPRPGGAGRRPAPATDAPATDALADALAAAILRHVDDAIFVVDADNRIVEWTESAARLFHLPRDAALARSFGDVLPFAMDGSSEEE